ncbi:hypothetical protein P691DRAFT_809203 [Macrolepiota fuliginosa MF-IS2]|uniref:Uncharacterized protein n=1 Tax=Macrolepiota fuliginosa MF-IS2 TaxID=1400762 RepID=A0A9P5X4L1_9AGAR|nr:hypothetical protein P691DRAFT_809203 [Macrolepiota fuliginosa MF-IS2]
MKNVIMKAIGKKKAEKPSTNGTRTGFEADCETLVNVPVRSALVSRDTETPVDIGFVEDQVWGPAPPSYDRQKSIFSRRR